MIEHIYEITQERSECMVMRLEEVLSKIFGPEIGGMNTKIVIWTMLAKVCARKLKELCPEILEGRN